MPVSLIDPWAYVQSNLPYTNTLPLGSNWQPGDIRLYFLSVSTSRSFTSATSGWTWITRTSGSTSSNTAVSRSIGILIRELQSGDAAPSVTAAGDPGINVGHLGITIRGADNATVLDTIPALTGSSASSRNVVAPTVNTGNGVLLTGHYVTRTSGANSGSWGIPSGMSTTASSLSDGAGGYNVLLASQAVTGGASGTKTAVAASAGVWSALSIFIPEKVEAGLPPGQFLPFFGR